MPVGMLAKSLFIRLFSEQELLAIDRSDIDAVRLIKIWLLTAETPIDRDSDLVITSVNALEQIGLLATGRAAEILGSNQ